MKKKLEVVDVSRFDPGEFGVLSVDPAKISKGSFSTVRAARGPAAKITKVVVKSTKSIDRAMRRVAAKDDHSLTCTGNKKLEITALVSTGDGNKKFSYELPYDKFIPVRFSAGAGTTVSHYVFCGNTLEYRRLLKDLPILVSRLLKVEEHEYRRVVRIYHDVFNHPDKYGV